MYLGNGVLLQASYVTSALQQQVARLFVEQLVMENEMLKELMQLKPWIMFKARSDQPDHQERSGIYIFGRLIQQKLSEWL